MKHIGIFLLSLSFASLAFGQGLPVIGQYNGVIHMANSHEDFEVTALLLPVSDSNNSAKQENSSVDFTGSLMAQDMDHSDSLKPKHSQLIEAMGGNNAIIIDSGNYNPISKNLVFTYKSSDNAPEIFGEFIGHLQDNKIVGTWVTKAYGTVGTFELTKSP